MTKKRPPFGGANLRQTGVGRRSSIGPFDGDLDFLGHVPAPRFPTDVHVGYDGFLALG